MSSLGEGESALGLDARAGSAVRRDPELVAAGLAWPFCARAAVADEGDRAAALLERALTAAAADLDRVMPAWRSRRVGLALGTSSGGMRAFESLAPPDRPVDGDTWINGTYLGPLLAVRRPCAFEPCALVLGACASATLAIGLGREWLSTGLCDVALCGGFDAVSVFVASGFEALRAVCTQGAPRPFRLSRDGLALGEGAAVLALVRGDDVPEAHAPRGWIIGFGASCDAVHLTAPDRTGSGLARAAAQAISAAGGPPIDLVSAHGTGTEFNDAAEALALASALGARASHVPVHALKGAIGHTLGAAGALETLAAVVALSQGIAPASAGEGQAMAGVRVLDVTEASDAATALKLSAAFGGANAALVIARSPHASERATRAVYVSRAVALVGDQAEAFDHNAFAARTGYGAARYARADRLVRLTLAAASAAEQAEIAAGRAPLRGAGIIVGHGLATLDTNALYLERIARVGAHLAEPRRFPYTSPNAAAGECAVAFGLTGPAFAVGGGPHGGIEALATAADLVRGGVASRIVVIAADEAGPASRRFAPETTAGAVALMVSAEPLDARLESATVRLEAWPGLSAAAPTAMHAHAALLPLATPETRQESLSAATPWGGFANARFFWL